MGNSIHYFSATNILAILNVLFALAMAIYSLIAMGKAYRVRFTLFFLLCGGWILLLLPVLMPIMLSFLFDMDIVHTSTNFTLRNYDSIVVINYAVMIASFMYSVGLFLISGIYKKLDRWVFFKIWLFAYPLFIFMVLVITIVLPFFLLFAVFGGIFVGAKSAVTNYFQSLNSKWEKWILGVIIVACIAGIIIGGIANFEDLGAIAIQEFQERIPVILATLIEISDIITGGVANFGGIADTYVVEPVQALTYVIPITAGGAHSLAIMSDGTLWAWGWNEYGQLGDGTATDRHRPVQVLTDVVSVTAGVYHSLAIRSDGTLWAWGRNEYGQLGDGTATDRHKPVQVLTDVISVSSRRHHSLAIKSDGTLWVWGWNEYGQVGDGTATDRHRPVQVLTDVVTVAAGGYHSLAMRSDGTLWAWGQNEYGQVSDGTTTDRLRPAQILTDVVSVVAGWYHSLAIRSDGTLWAWGRNEYGQLGDGTATDRHRPLQILTDVITVAAGGGNSLAISNDGTLWSWGWNEYGQVGDGTTIPRLSPVQVSIDIASVVAGYRHSLAISSDGTLWAWGWNGRGRLGDGTTTARHEPLPTLNIQVIEDPTEATGTKTVPRHSLLWIYNINHSPSSVSISFDGSYIAIGTSGGVYLLDRNRNLLWSYPTDLPITDISMTADASKIFAGGSNGVVVPDGILYAFNKQGELLYATSSTGISSVSISPEGYYFAKTYVHGLGWNDVVSLWGFGEGEWLWNYNFGRDETAAVSMSAKGAYIAVGGAACPWGYVGGLRLYSKAGNLLWEHGIDIATLSGGKYSVSISSDGKYIVAGNQRNDYLYFFGHDQGILWNYNTGPIKGASVSEDGNYIVAASTDKAYLFDRYKSLLWTAEIDAIRDVSISADASLIVLVTNENEVYAFDL